MRIDNIPPKYQEWLNARGISDEVLLHNNISVREGQIVIPVYDETGVFLFNKYRRSPFSEEGPKYRYDKGATGALYNINNAVFPGDPVFLCEGELDALSLQSKGSFAVSTTGGSGTFKLEWKSLIDERPIYICYDNDEAGMNGTIRLLGIFPKARVVLIPKEDGIKDVTDFLMQKVAQWGTLVKEAQTWELPLETNSLLKKDIKKCTDSCSQQAILLGAERQRRLSRNEDVQFVELLLAHLRNRYDFYNHKLKYKRPQIRDGDAIAKARTIPITEFISFNRQGNALCISHTDGHPSMHYFKKNNKVQCFSCSFNGDTIDVVQKLFNLTVGEAIKKINGI